MNKKIKILLALSMVILTAVTTLGCEKEVIQNIVSTIKVNITINDNTIIEYIKEYFDTEITSKEYKINSYAEGNSNYINMIAIDKNHKSKMYFLTMIDENGKKELVELYRRGIEGEAVKTTRDEKIEIAKDFLVQKGFVTSKDEINYVGIHNGASAEGEKVGFEFKLNDKEMIVSVSNTDSKVCHFSMFDK
ncbi:MAG: hypothetical protein ACRCXT_19690 [Paraclostridium sp.]